MIAAYIVAAAAGFTLVWSLLTYNKFVRLRNEAEQSFSGIEIQLKRRADLIPPLVETVKGYAGHEQQTLQAVTAARSATISAESPNELAAADGLMQMALGQFRALAEDYPDLKASDNFQALSDQLVETEDRIAGTRQLYNAVVRRFNTLQQQFPPSIIASIGGFTTREFYRPEDDSDRANPQVSLT